MLGPVGCRTILPPVPETDWSTRVAALWTTIDDVPRESFVAAMQALVDERPDDDAVAHYELGSAFDSTGYEAEAAVAYARAFALGLPTALVRPATIQYASTLRNLGRADEAVELLDAERHRTRDELDDAVAVFLAFALTDAGHPVRAVGEVTAAMAAHLPRYQRSVRAYAQDLIDRG